MPFENTSEDVKKEVVEAVREKMTQRCDEPAHLGQLCLYWSHETAKELHRRGIAALPQAGSIQWPRIDMRDDDGVVQTHFAMMFTEGNVASCLARGILPEMHCWCAIPSRNEIIDLTTSYLPSLCEKMAGLEWTAEAPPDYLWVTHLPKHVYYRPSEAACILALKILVAQEGREALDYMPRQKG